MLKKFQITGETITKAKICKVVRVRINFLYKDGLIEPIDKAISEQDVINWIYADKFPEFSTVPRHPSSMV